jgi:hypothetical protein
MLVTIHLTLIWINDSEVNPLIQSPAISISNGQNEMEIEDKTCRPKILIPSQQFVTD